MFKVRSSILGVTDIRYSRIPPQNRVPGNMVKNKKNYHVAGGGHSCTCSEGMPSGACSKILFTWLLHWAVDGCGSYSLAYSYEHSTYLGMVGPVEGPAAC